MRQLFDIYHDSGKTVFSNICQDYEARKQGMPAFVVNHRAMSDTDLAKLAPSEFAAPRDRMFPICSKADTWTSIAYYNALAKKAALSPASATDREEIRGMLAKAASLWGLDDDEVKQLVHDVTLAMPRKASADEAPVGERAAAFSRQALQLAEPERREQATMLLRAAEAEDFEPEMRKQLFKHAGAATCTAQDAAVFIGEILPQIPFRSEFKRPLSDMQTALLHMAASDLLDPDDVSGLVGIVEKVETTYHLKRAASDRLRLFGPDDAAEVTRDLDDQIRLPGGIVARKSAIEENAALIGNHLSNLCQVDAYGPEQITEALGKLSPVEVASFRPLIGA